MNMYRKAVPTSTDMKNDPADLEYIAALVRDDEVHADVYLSSEVFALEQERLFSRTWQFVGHASQVPAIGDFYTTEVAGEPLVMLRRTDGSVGVLENRCAHKGTAIFSRRSGNTGKLMRCPYHAWTYRLDGSLMSMPARSDYGDTSFQQCAASKGLGRPSTANYRGFIFVRLAEQGPAFEEYAGEMLKVLDNLLDRSPKGELLVTGGCLRSVLNCNWKMYLENVNDAIHAVPTHDSVISATTAVWNAQTDQSSKPMAVEQLLPFGQGLDFVKSMGSRVFANGHSILGTKASLHVGYAALAQYEAVLTRRHGEAKAKEILSFSPQNAILYPTMAVKCSPQLIRVVRPLAADRTLIEAWALELEGAPEELLQRTISYNRLVYSPMSAVAHDDIHVFESMQQSLRARGNRWVSLHRLHRPDETCDGRVDHLATSEILMRNQFRTWRRWMTQVESPRTAA